MTKKDVCPPCLDWLNEIRKSFKCKSLENATFLKIFSYDSYQIMSPARQNMIILRLIVIFGHEGWLTLLEI